MTTSVILAVRGGAEAELAAAFASHRDFDVARRCADLVEAVAAASAGVGGLVVLSDQPHLDRAVVRSFAQQAVTVVGVPSTADAHIRLVGLGIGTVVPCGSTVEDVLAAALSALAEPEIPAPTEVGTDPQASGMIVAVWGPTGAPGRTTLAVNLAFELAAMAPSVVLVDADTYGGAVAQALGLMDEAPGIAAVARAALQGASINEAIRRHASEVRPGLRVLSGISRSARWGEIPGAALQPMWAAVRAVAAVTVVDCGFGVEQDGPSGLAAGRNDATLSTLAEADLVVIVGSADPLGVQRLVQALADIAEVPGAGSTPRIVVVNRVRSSVAGHRPNEAVADVLARYAAVSEVWVVPDDQKACDAATLAGEALGERAPHAPVRRAFEAIARRVWADLMGIKAASAAAEVETSSGEPETSRRRRSRLVS